MTGAVIAFFEGRTWFVLGALAGEEVERACSAPRQVVEARTERVFKASELRRPTLVSTRSLRGCSVQLGPTANSLP